MRTQHIPIIGISPRNGFFSPENIGLLIDETLKTAPRAVVMVADEPDIQNWKAFGYSDSKARQKARLASNNLKNKVRDHCRERGYSDDRVHILDWATEVSPHPVFQEKFQKICALYDQNEEFRRDVRSTTEGMITNTLKNPRFAQRDIDMEEAIDTAKHYLLAELAYFENAPALHGSDSMDFVYYRPFPIYERYLNGYYNNTNARPLGLRIIEAEDMTRRIPQVKGLLSDAYKVNLTLPHNVLRVGFTPYYPGIYYDEQRGQYGGIFYDLLEAFARRQNMELRLVEETGYGVALDALNDDRFDLFCNPTWATPEREDEGLLSVPLYANPVGVFVRKDSPLIHTGWDDLDGEDHVISTKDNDVTDVYAAEFMPTARTVNTPQLAPISELLDRVSEGRATATFVDPVLAYRHMMKTGRKDLVNIAVDCPLLTTPNHFMGSRNKPELMASLNQSLMAFQQGGLIRQAIHKHVGSFEGIMPWGLTAQPSSTLDGCAFN